MMTGFNGENWFDAQDELSNKFRNRKSGNY